MYLIAYRPRLKAVVRFAAGLAIDLLVLPEYAVPLALLPAVAEAAGERMTVIAGTHTVTPEGVRKSGLYEKLAFTPKPTIGSAVAPVLRGGRAVAAVLKLSASQWEPDLRLGSAWEPVLIGEERLGVLICLDFLKLRDGDVAPKVGPRFDHCSLFAVPSLTPMLSVGHFASNGEEGIYGYGRPVVYANRAREGGTRIFVVGAESAEGAGILAAGTSPPVLPAGVEGVVMAEVRFGEMRERYRPVVSSRPLGAAVVLDAGAWPELRAAEEALLSAGEAEQAFAQVEAGEQVFRKAAVEQRLPAIARERWGWLGDGAPGITQIDHLHVLARDVWVEGVASEAEIERALVEGAAQVLREVEKAAPTGSKVVTVRGLLEGEVLKRFEGVAADAEVLKGVTEGLVPEPERVSLPGPAEDGSFQRWVMDPGPFPVKLTKRGYTAYRQTSDKQWLRVEEVIDKDRGRSYISHPVAKRAEMAIERGAGLLALWGHAPAWVASGPGGFEYIVLTNGRPIVCANAGMPSEEHMRDARTPTSTTAVLGPRCGCRHRNRREIPVRLPSTAADGPQVRL
ncbi:hypothetical protein [Sorangium atrum]|uniref:CN hydrolase domain-containing protein n=1 Tax=Sorangium atrum TaxID=2995308 RepID=A0ABT5BXW1_9BACT|nr:hypothetical protein [Sorangium aterium]MDC0678991.1 hypothetical protein [Sorangium aterium]